MEEGDENRPVDPKSPPPLPGDHHTGVAKDEGIIGSAENKKVLVWTLIVTVLLGGFAMWLLFKISNWLENALEGWA